ncbi:efflux RND transporter permease subunit, partial [Pelagibacteraceae bacterium]|nr:efflux RND transporter permease subunit [Pelagibacteraceae bacterium]
MLRNILSAVLLRKKTISTLLLMIILLGVISYLTFPKEEMPEIDLKTVAVIIKYDGMSANEIEKLIVEPIERELMALKDLDEIISISKDNIASFMVSFKLDTENDSLAKLVRNTISDANDKLPREMEIIEVKEYDSSMFSRIYIGLYGNVPYEVLLKAANSYKDSLEKIGNVTEVDIKGEREEIIKITLDPTLLQKYKINISDVYNALKSYNNIVPAGALTDDNADFSVKIPGLYQNYRQIKNLPINANDNFTLSLGDIAEVKRSYDRSKNTVIVNGQPALSLEVSRKSGTNVLDTYKFVKNVLKENEGKFHPLIKTVIVDDESTEIKQRIESSENTVITAVILVMIIVIAALGIRSGLIVGLSIPTTYLFSILILDYMGMTYNLMTVFGLILAVGLLVDGPIVITEFARAEQERGVRRRDSYINSSYNMFWPIIASALTTIAAFFPLLFWPEMLGQWLRVIPLTVIVVL